MNKHEYLPVKEALQRAYDCLLKMDSPRDPELRLKRFDAINRVAHVMNFIDKVNLDAEEYRAMKALRKSRAELEWATIEFLTTVEGGPDVQTKAPKNMRRTYLRALGAYLLAMLVAYLPLAAIGGVSPEHWSMGMKFGWTCWCVFVGGLSMLAIIITRMK